MRVIVAGAGIGGLSAAVALRRRGIDVLLIEQAERFGEAGAGLQLSPNAMRVLDGWGLGAAVRAIGFAPEAAEVRDRGSGRLLLRTELGEAAERRWSAPYLQVHRADLHALLIDALHAAGRAEVRLGARVVGVAAHHRAVAVTLASGESLEADVLIGADGVRSVIREGLFGPAAARFTGQVAWRATVEAARLTPGLIPPMASVWAGAGKHFVHYFVRGGGLVNMVGVVERDWRAESWTERGDPAQFAADFAGWPEPVPTLTRNVEEAWRWALYDRPPLPRWSVGRATLLGDAAHPMPPFLAQGAAMAIEDAEALANRLDGAREVEPALQAYERDRRARTTRVQAWSRRNARLFHLPRPVAAAAFGAAGLLDRLEPSLGARRFDWLYGYGRS